MMKSEIIYNDGLVAKTNQIMENNYSLSFNLFFKMNLNFEEIENYFLLLCFFFNNYLGCKIIFSHLTKITIS